MMNEMLGNFKCDWTEIELCVNAIHVTICFNVLLLLLLYAEMWKHSLENHHKGNVIQKQNAYNIQTAHQDKRECCDHRKRISLWSVCPIIKQQEEWNTHPIDVRKEIWLTKNCSEMIQLHSRILLHSSVPLPDQLAVAFIRITIFWNFFLKSTSICVRLRQKCSVEIH